MAANFLQQTFPDQIAIRDVNEVQRKIDIFLAAGHEHLQIVTDFDRTVTKCFNKAGQLVDSSHGAIERSVHLPQDFRDALHKNFNLYYPREIDQSLSRAEREIFMHEWWETTHAMFIQYKLNRQVLPQIIADSNIEMRDGFAQLFDTLRQQNIPVLIFSAGIANVVEQFLQNERVLTNNMHIVANKMVFGDDGTITGFESKTIHSMNKNGTALKNNKAGWAHDHDRTNILVIGDNVSDTEMVQGLDYKEVISIGFLNDKVTERLEHYKAHFDVVIVGDGSTAFIQALVEAICSKKL